MTKKQIYLSIIFGVIFCIGLYDFLPSLKENQNTDTLQVVAYNYKKDTPKKKEKPEFVIYDGKGDRDQNPIKKLTKEDIVIDYVKRHHRLPDYYITKSEARRHGWKASEGNLCDVLPNKAIGGDRFGNREGRLPKGEQYYEADVNYNCGRRNSDRIVFTKNGDVWITKNHYKTFEKR